MLASSILISNVVVAQIENKTMHIPISFSSEHTNGRTVEMKALLDTGAGGKFIDQNFVLQNDI